MHVVPENGSIVLAETFEGLISADLMSGGHLEGSNRSQSTVVFNSVYNIGQAIELTEVLGRNLDFLLFGDITEVGIFSLGSIAFFSIALGFLRCSAIALTLWKL